MTECLLSGGYFSVHTRLCFDSKIFTPKTDEYLKNINEIVEKLCDLYGELNEKKKHIKILMQRLINSWKEEDLKKPNKLICNLCFTLGKQSKKNG